MTYEYNKGHQETPRIEHYIQWYLKLIVIFGKEMIEKVKKRYVKNFM